MTLDSSPFFSYQDMEVYLSEMVVNKKISCLIDRLDKVVHFTKTKTPNEVLDEWSYNTDRLMHHINQVSHLVAKELVVHGV